jgi:hypothetical protein
MCTQPVILDSMQATYRALTGDARVGRLVFWKEIMAPQPTMPQPQLMSIQAAKVARDGSRAAEINSFTKARGVGNNK